MLTRILVFVTLAGLPFMGYGQGRTIELYPYNYTSISPAFAGVDGTKFTFIANAFFVKGGPSTGFTGAETSFKNIGFGVTASRSRLGAETFTEYALPVNYQWKINEKNKLIFGTRLSYQRQAIDWTQYIPLDPNDPLLASADKTITVAGNISLAALYKRDLFYAGFSVDNLLTREKRESFDGLPVKYNLIIGKDTEGKGNFSSMHSVYISIVNERWFFDVNNAVIFKNRFIAGFSIEFNDNEESLPKINAGVKFGDYGKAVVMLYSRSNDIDTKTFSGQLFLVFTLPAL